MERRKEMKNKKTDFISSSWFEHFWPEILPILNHFRFFIFKQTTRLLCCDLPLKLMSIDSSISIALPRSCVCVRCVYSGTRWNLFCASRDTIDRTTLDRRSLSIHKHLKNAYVTIFHKSKNNNNNDDNLNNNTEKRGYDDRQQQQRRPRRRTKPLRIRFNERKKQKRQKLSILFSADFFFVLVLFVDFASTSNIAPHYFCSVRFDSVWVPCVCLCQCFCFWLLLTQRNDK